MDNVIKAWAFAMIIFACLILVNIWASPYFNPEEQCTFKPECNNGHFEVWTTAKSFRGECPIPDFNFLKTQCEGK